MAKSARKVPVLQQGYLYNTQNVVNRAMDYWKSQSYSALHYRQAQYENAAPDHQRVAYEQVEIAAALSMSRTAAQMTFQIQRD